jgi:hypothetical protein
MKKGNTCAVLAVQCLERLDKAPPEKREALKRRAKLWLTLAADKRRAREQKH